MISTARNIKSRQGWTAAGWLRIFRGYQGLEAYPKGLKRPVLACAADLLPLSG
jgi:hypothetical protein